MKIKTITCHDVYNHGASLQAYALQTYLESLGHDVEIIDYKPPYLSGHYNLWAVCNPAYDKPILKQAYLLAKLPGRLCSLRRKKAFDMFTQRYLKLTRCYNSYEELESDIPEADVYIAGSDQIWNTLFPNGRDKAFYLAFAPKDKLKMSYAASFSTPDVKNEYRPFVRQMLKNLDRVSVREKSSLPLLASLGRSDGIAVCDPVFLLSKEEWKALLPNSKKKENYLLVYDTECSKALKTIAEEIAKRKQLAIYNVSAFRFGYAKENCPNAGPLDFLNMIDEASYVVSNSFHATAFSLIFEKDFCVVNRSEDINERMQSLLESYGILNRLVKLDDLNSCFQAIDYSTLRDQIKHNILQSKTFLANNFMSSK